MAKNRTPSKPKRALSVVPAESGPAETQDSRCREAYQAVLPEANALCLQGLARVNLNATTAVTTVLQVLPLILPYREQSKRLPRFDIGNFDRLEVAVATPRRRFAPSEFARHFAMTAASWSRNRTRSTFKLQRSGGLAFLDPRRSAVVT